MLAIVIPLSLVAAFFYALSDFLEQRAAARTVAGEPDGSRLGASRRLAAAGRSAVRTLRRLTHDRLWFLGWAVGTNERLASARTAL